MQKKVVYYVGHYGGFLLCMLHKAKYYEKNDAIYIYVKTYSSKSTNDFMERISNNVIPQYGKVVCMDERKFWGAESEEETKDRIIEYYNKVFSDNGVSLENVDIYMNFDEFNSMGIYLEYMKCAGTVGIITTSLERLVSYVDMYLFNEIEDRLFYSLLQRKCRTLDKDGAYVTKIIRTFDIECLDSSKVREEALSNAKTYEYFDLSEAKKNLTNEQKDALYNIFAADIKEADGNQYNMLLLSSNFTAFKLGTTEEEFVYGNQILVDYFLGNAPLAIKPHPRADYGEEIWRKAFNKSYYIPSYLPAEYLEKLGIGIGTLLATGSMGTGYASENANKKVNVGRMYWFNYRHMHKLYNSVAMAAYIGANKLFYYGIPEEMVSTLIESNPQFNVFDKCTKVSRINDVEDDSVLIIPVHNTDGIDQNNWMRAELESLVQTEKKVCFIFWDASNDYADGVWNSAEVKMQFVDFIIEKEKNKEYTFGDGLVEEFSVYCRDIRQRAKVKKYVNSYSLKNAGLSLNIYCKEQCQMCKDDVVQDYLIDIVKGMGATFRNMTKSMNSLVNFVDERIGLINNFEQYLLELKEIDKMIIISVRDTPGHRITPILSKKLLDIGVKEDLHSKHWNSYVAIINKNRLVYEKLDAEKKVYYQNVIMENDVLVESAALKHGNKSSIEINGHEYSLNGRGLNIVVFDLAKKKLIDSVCFDTHSMGVPCSRRETKIF